MVGSYGSGGRLGEGREGSGYWFKGVNNYVTDNVAANIMSDANDAAYGSSTVPYHLGNVRIPKFQGADTTVDANVTVRNANAMPILEFARNEVYGATESGLTYWWSERPIPSRSPRSGALSKTFACGHARSGHLSLPVSKMRIDGLIVRSTDPGPSSACCQLGIDFGDYYTNDFVLVNSDIQGRDKGLSGSPKAGNAATTSPFRTRRSRRARDWHSRSTGTSARAATS